VLVGHTLLNLKGFRLNFCISLLGYSAIMPALGIGAGGRSQQLLDRTPPWAI
jgi:hypothetical protein